MNLPGASQGLAQTFLTLRLQEERAQTDVLTVLQYLSAIYSLFILSLVHILYEEKDEFNKLF